MIPLKQTSKEEMVSSDRAVSWQNNLRILWISELLAVLGFGITKPLLPLYVRELGAQSEEWVRIWAGIVVSAPGLTMIVFGPLWGTLSDRYGSKVMVLRAALSAAVLTSLMAVAQTAQHLALLRVVMGIFGGTVSAAATLVALAAPHERHGQAFGTLHTVVFIGGSAGPLVGGIVADYFGYSNAFWAASGVLLVASIVVLILLREPPRREPFSRISAPSTGDPQPLHRRLVGPFASVLKSPQLLGVLGVGFLLRLAEGMAVPIVPLFIESISAPGARVASVTGVVRSVSAFFGALGSLGTGKASEWLGGRRLLALLALLSAIGYLLHLVVDAPLWVLPVQACTGFALGGLVTVLRISLSEHSEGGQEGTVYGVESSTMSVAFAVGPMMGSLLAAWFSLRLSFLVSAAMFAVAGVAALALKAWRE